MIANLGCGVKSIPVNVPRSFWPAITLVPILIEVYRRMMNRRIGKNVLQRPSTTALNPVAAFTVSIGKTIRAESDTDVMVRPKSARMKL